ncbi:MAG: hypothetical protein NVSMB57_08930 [Actinomycetota bacterium]
MKLVTTTAAVLRLGSDFRFVTRVVGPLPNAGGVVLGAVALIGSGDPTFASASFASRHFIREARGGKVRVFRAASPTVEMLAQEVSKHGVRRIAGDLIADESIFDSQRSQRGWQASYQRGDPDVGNLSGLPVNLGLDRNGKKVERSPATLAGALLRDALSARGVTVSGTVRVGRAPSGSSGKELGRVLSPPLREIIAWTNRWSINYAAEELLKDLGARFGGRGTTGAGVAIVGKTLGAAGIDVSGLRMSDGSGLSLDDRVRPVMILRILQRILSLDGEAGTTLRDSLPVAGQPGTLLKRMTGAPTGGNLRGKTGLIKGVRALAGWVRTKDGTMLVYVALFNHVRNPAAMTSVLDGMGKAFSLLPG